MPAEGKPGDGRATRWDSHRAERRGELVEAAVRAIDRDGPDVSMAAIAVEAGVSKPVLYRYFADKDQLHVAVGQWGADEVLARVVPPLLADVPMRQRIERCMTAYLAAIEEHHQVFLLLVRHRAAGGDPLADGKARIAAALARVLGDALREIGIDSAGRRAVGAERGRHSGSPPASGGSNGAPCRARRSVATWRRSSGTRSKARRPRPGGPSRRSRDRTSAPVTELRRNPGTS